MSRQAMRPLSLPSFFRIVTDHIRYNSTARRLYRLFYRRRTRSRVSSQWRVATAFASSSYKSEIVKLATCHISYVWRFLSGWAIVTCHFQEEKVCSCPRGRKESVWIPEYFVCIAVRYILPEIVFCLLELLAKKNLVRVFTIKYWLYLFYLKKKNYSFWNLSFDTFDVLIITVRILSIRYNVFH